MTTAALAHGLSFFQRRGGELLTGGVAIGELVGRHGTPLYVYDLGVARAKARRLAEAFGPGFELHYAIKANPHPAVIEFFARLGLGFDVASQGELERALSAGADPARMGFAGPGKRRGEIARAIECGLGSLNAESLRELEIIEELASGVGRTASVSLRLNPEEEVKRSGMRMGGGARPFGIDAEQAIAALDLLKTLTHLRFKGFHIFAGSQNLKIEPLIENIGAALSLVAKLAPACPRPPEMVNLGGGFGIPYAAADEPLDIDALGARAQELTRRFEPLLGGARLVLESGRYLIGEAGIYVVRVLYRKVSRGTTFLVTDGGLHHHLAATGNLGQVVHRPYPMAAIRRLDEAPCEAVAVVGPLCTPLDTFGAKVELPRLDEGDLIGVLCSGAYGLSASPRGFLGHPEPAEVVVGDAP